MSGGAPPDLLGKDEVASSNLASSSIKQKSAQQSGLFVLFRRSRFELANLGPPVPGWPLLFYSFVQNPFPGIVLNVLPNLVIILLIADHVIVIRPLEDGFSNFLRYKNLN